MLFRSAHRSLKPQDTTKPQAERISGAEAIVRSLENLGTDLVFGLPLAQNGTARMLAERINDLKPAYFNRWADYHIRTCEEPSILGSSNHGLIIARKHDW